MPVAAASRVPRPPYVTGAATVPPPPPAAPAQKKEAWEVTVGTNWLAKIGALITVFGIAMAVRYYIPHTGPWGRIIVGVVSSLALLGAGIAFERRDRYRAYGYTLIGAGWAGLYFTSYAAHAIDSARVIDSDIAGTVLLLLVATGMIAHSLRYRAQVVTALAYIVAFGTLALTPLTGFSLVATVPLAISVLIVAQRFGWLGVSILGVASTYLVFSVRALGPGGSDAINPYTAVPYLALGVYWLTFEIADIFGLKQRAKDAASTPLFVLNAIGFVGSLLLVVPSNDTRLISLVSSIAGGAYIATALIRLRLHASFLPAGHIKRTDFNSSHAAIGIAAALLVLATELRFSGTREALTLLLLAELLFATGLLISDRHIRRIGAVLTSLVAGHVMYLAVDPVSPVLDWAWTMRTSTPLAALVAAVWYVNREWLPARDETPWAMEHLFTWTATALVIAIGVRELTPAHQGLAGLIFAALLLEAGLRRGAEYRYQSYILFFLSAASLAVVFVLDPASPISPLTPSKRDVWMMLPAAAVVAYGVTFRLRRFLTDPHAGELRVVAAFAACLGTAIVVTLEWHVVPQPYVALAWTLTAMALVALGYSSRLTLARWQGYPLLVLATLRAFEPLLVRGLRNNTELAVAAAATAALYVASILGRRAARTFKSTTAPAEQAVAIILAVIGTWSMATLEWHAVRPIVVGPTWAISALALLIIGVWRMTPDVRWQAYALLVVSAIQSFQPIAASTSAGRDAILWMSVVIGVIYAATFVSRSGLREEAATGRGIEVEEACRVMLSLVASALAAGMIYQEVRPSLITQAWGLEGLALLAIGFPVRERVFRLTGLALLFVCILKLFVYDLRELESVARMLSFVVLGLVLLGVSWTYTRFREQITKFL